jgi:hypothetical protein
MENLFLHVDEVGNEAFHPQEAANLPTTEIWRSKKYEYTQTWGLDDDYEDDIAFVVPYPWGEGWLPWRVEISLVTWRRERNVRRR